MARNAIPPEATLALAPGAPPPVASEGGHGRIRQLFQEHNEALVRMLANRLGSIDEAVEVAQEAYVRLLRLDRADAVSHLQAYLFRTARNIAIDRLRSRHRAQSLFEPGADDREVCDGGPDADEMLAGRERLRRLTEIVNALPPKCRYAFVRHRIDGAGYPEIAREMNLTQSMVRKYVLRALLACRTALGDDEPATVEEPR